MFFGHFPYELRSQIWSLAAEPRRITNARMVKSKLPFKKKHHVRGVDILYETTSTPAPAGMQIYRESCQHPPYQRASTRGTEPRWIWVNSELDIFCITSVYYLKHIVSHRSKVQRLQIRTDDDDYWYEAIPRGNTLRDLDEFVSLKKIRVVMAPRDLAWAEILAEFEWNLFGQCLWANLTIQPET